jgi:hypothetical protein
MNTLAAFTNGGHKRRRSSSSQLKVGSVKAKMKWKTTFENSIKAQLKSSLAADPTNVEALRKMGLLLTRQGDYKKVITFIFVICIILLASCTEALVVFNRLEITSSLQSRKGMTLLKCGRRLENVIWSYSKPGGHL